jgi:glycosyltransferase involved in cell wall biosynthesis
MSAAQDRPLLTFGIAAFNQERFIREAVEAAFAQTYSPLEIVLSDDCSRDRTFDIMKEMAAAYRGPHRIILNRNRGQRCIGGHINAVVEVSHGELIVGAAGDDVSAPQRTQAAFDAWEWSGRRATSIHTDIIQIDEDGRPVTQIYKAEAPKFDGRFCKQPAEVVSYVRTLAPCVLGCSHTFSRELFRRFGDLPDEIIHEDNALSLRSAMVGTVVYVNEPLVKYRVHGSNVFVTSRERGMDLPTLARQENRMRRDFRTREIMYNGFLRDLEKGRQLGILNDADYARAREEAERKRRRFGVQREYIESGLFSKSRLLFRLREAGVSREEIRILAARLLPLPLLLRVQLLRSYAAAVRGR